MSKITAIYTINKICTGWEQLASRGTGKEPQERRSKSNQVNKHMCEWTFRFLSAICRVFISFHPLNELCFQVTIITSYIQHTSMHMATTLFPILFASCKFWGFVLNYLAWPYLSLFLSINYFICIKKLVKLLCWKNNDWLIDLDRALSTLCLRSISFEITFFICTKRINFLNLK